MSKNDLKELLYWYLSTISRHKGTYIMVLALGLNITVDAFYQPVNGDLFHFVYSSELNTPISIFALILGFALQAFQIHKDSHKRAFIFQHFGISDGNTFNIPQARPIRDKLNVPETYTIDAHQYYENGILKDPQKALDTTLSIEGILKSKSRVENDNSKYYYGGISQVPLTFVAGTLFENTRKIEVYDWNRDQEKTYLIDSGGKPLGFSVKEPDNLTGRKIAIEIALTYSIDHDNTIDAIGEISTIRIEADIIERDNTSTKEAQESVYKEFHKLLDKYSTNQIEEVHIFVSAQNSMIFQLGRQITKRLHKKIIVWQYEAQNKNPNPWGIAISHDGYQIIKNHNLEKTT